MPSLWRLYRARHGPGLDGLGGLFAAGRWHSLRERVVYFGGSAAIVVLERLAHTDPGLLPNDLQLARFEFPEPVLETKAEELAPLPGQLEPGRKRNAPGRIPMAAAGIFLSVSGALRDSPRRAPFRAQPGTFRCAAIAAGRRAPIHIRPTPYLVHRLRPRGSLLGRSKARKTSCNAHNINNIGPTWLRSVKGIPNALVCPASHNSAQVCTSLPSTHIGRCTAHLKRNGEPKTVYNL